MTEKYVQLEVAAELEGVTYHCLWGRVKRNPEEYRIKAEPQLDGGRDRVLVAVSSLSWKARRTYRKTQGIEGGEIVAKERTDVDQRPWYVEKDLVWYMENYAAQYEKAQKLAEDVRVFLTYDEAERTSFAAEYAQEMGTSQRSLYRYAEKYLEAQAWAIRLAMEEGKSYDHLKVLALCRKPKESNTFPSIGEEQKALIENIWFDRDFARNLGTVEMLYGEFARRCEEAGQEYPSYQTVTRYVRYLMDTRRMKNAHQLAERGEREYKRTVQLKGLRDTSAVPVMGIIQGDSHTFDVWVKYIDPVNGKVSAIRPTMVAWIDTRSRVVMGCVMAKTINSQVIKQSMIKLVYEYGVPKCILIDNGKDYTAQEMTGRSRKIRGGYLRLGQDEQGFYRSLGIEDDYRALPYQPWGKGQVERFFGTVCQQFSKWFASYTGTLTGSKTAGKVRKDIKKLLEQDKLLTLEQFYEMFEMWLENKYHQKEHRGLKQIGEKWTKPMELFRNAEERIEIPAPPKELAAVYLMKPGWALVRQTGIHKFGQVYMNYALAAYKDEKVRIRWNPDDVSRLFVYDKDGRQICEAECQKLLQFQGLISEKQLVEHLRNQNRQLADDRRRLEEMRTPYELRAHEGDPQIAGKMDLMLENDVKRILEDLEEQDIFKEKQISSDYFSKRAKDKLKELGSLG